MCLDPDNPPRVQPQFSQPAGRKHAAERIRAARAPKHIPTAFSHPQQPDQQRSGETNSRRVTHFRSSLSNHLMDTSQCQPTAGETTVQHSHAKRNHWRHPDGTAALDRPHLSS
jgi:hypothetical protein